MTASLHAAFDFADTGAFSVGFTDSGGTAAIPFASGKYSAVSIATVVTDTAHFATALQTALNANATLAGVYVVTFSTSTLKYTVSANIVFSMTFTLPSVASRVLGFTGNKSGASTYTSDVRVYYSIALAQGGVGGPAFKYKPQGYAEEAFTEGGDHYAVRTGVLPKFYDFGVQLETKAASDADFATAAVPWTFEHFFDFVGNTGTFALVTDQGTSVHRLRSDCSSYSPQQAMADYDGYYNFAFRTVLRGRV